MVVRVVSESRPKKPHAFAFFGFKISGTKKQRIQVIYMASIYGILVSIDHHP